MSARPVRVLLVDDDESFRRVQEYQLVQAGYAQTDEVAEPTQGREAIVCHFTAVAQVELSQETSPLVSSRKT